MKRPFTPLIITAMIMCGAGIAVLMMPRSSSDATHEGELVVGAPVATKFPYDLDLWWSSGPVFTVGQDGRVHNLSSSLEQRTLLDSGRIILPNTYNRRPVKARVGKQEGKAIPIEILEGDYAGRTGWTSYGYVN